MHIPPGIPRNFAFAADTTVQYAAECNRNKEQAAHLAYAALLAGGEEPSAVAARFGVTLEAVQRVCELAGHEWVMTEDGDPATPHFRQWRACAVCGAPDDEEDWSE